MKEERSALKVRVVSGDVLARRGLAGLLQRLGVEVVVQGAAVAVWDLGAAGTPPAIRMSADEPVLALYADAGEARRALEPAVHSGPSKAPRRVFRWLREEGAWRAM